MVVREKWDRFDSLMVLIEERLRHAEKLEGVVPLVEVSCREDISQLERYRKVVGGDSARIFLPRIAHALKEAERIAVMLFTRTRTFLRSAQAREKLETEIRIIETVHPLKARDLRDELRDFCHLVRWDEATTEEMVESFLTLASAVSREHQKVIGAGIAEVTRPQPSKSHKKRHSAGHQKQKEAEAKTA